MLKPELLLHLRPSGIIIIWHLASVIHVTYQDVSAYEERAKMLPWTLSSGTGGSFWGTLYILER